LRPHPPPPAEPRAPATGAASPELASQVRGLMQEASLRLDEVETSGQGVRADLPGHVTPASSPSASPGPGPKSGTKRGIVVAKGWGRASEA